MKAVIVKVGNRPTTPRRQTTTVAVAGAGTESGAGFVSLAPCCDHNRERASLSKCRGNAAAASRRLLGEPRELMKPLFDCDIEETRFCACFFSCGGFSLLPFSLN